MTKTEVLEMFEMADKCESNVELNLLLVMLSLPTDTFATTPQGLQIALCCMGDSWVSKVGVMVYGQKQGVEELYQLYPEVFTGE